MCAHADATIGRKKKQAVTHANAGRKKITKENQLRTQKQIGKKGENIWPTDPLSSCYERKQNAVLIWNSN